MRIDTGPRWRGINRLRSLGRSRSPFTQRGDINAVLPTTYAGIENPPLQIMMKSPLSLYSQSVRDGIDPVIRGHTPHYCDERHLKSGAPYNDDQSDEIRAEMRKDVVRGGMFLVSIDVLADSDLFLCCPTTTAANTPPHWPGNIHI